MSLMENLKLNDVVDVFDKIWQSAVIKLIVSALVAVFSFGFDGTHNKSLLAVFTLIIIDCISAIVAAYISGEQVRSSKFFRTPIKLVIYFGLIYAAKICEYTIPLIGFLDETVMGFVATTELISIMENVHKMGYQVPSQLIKKLINIRDKS